MSSDKEIIQKMLDELRKLRKRINELEKQVLEYKRKLEEEEKEIIIKEPKQIAIHELEEIKPIRKEKVTVKERLPSKHIPERKIIPKKEEIKPLEVKGTQKKFPVKAAIEEPTEKISQPEIPIPKEIEMPSEIEEEKPTDLEVTIGTSLFQRVGLLFLVVSSMATAFWMYYEIIPKLSIYGQVALIYSFGAIVLLVGLKLYSTRLPRWYADGIAATGIGILFAISVISYYLFEIFSLTQLGGALGAVFILDIILARKFNSLGLFLEALISSVLVGFLVAWWYPNYPFAQVYMIFLYLFLFLKLPEKTIVNNKIMVLSYFIFVLLTMIQSVLLAVEGVPPHISLQFMAAISCSLVYVSYETKNINRTLNYSAALVSIITSTMFLRAPLEAFMCSLLASYIGKDYIRRRIKKELSYEELQFNTAITLMASFLIVGYDLGLSLFNVESTLTPLSGMHYMTAVVLVILILYKIELRRLGIIKPPTAKVERTFQDIIALSTFLLENLFLFLYTGVLNTMTMIFIPLLFMYLNDMIGSSKHLNYTLNVIAFLEIIYFLQVETVLLLPTYVLMTLTFQYKLNKIHDIYHKNLIYGLSYVLNIGIGFRLLQTTYSFASYLCLYLFLITTALWIKEAKDWRIERIQYDIAYPISTLLVYSIQILSALSLGEYSYLNFVSVIIVYLILNNLGSRATYNHITAISILPLIHFITQNICEFCTISLFAAYVSILLIRTFLKFKNYQELTFYDFYLTVPSAIYTAIVLASYELAYLLVSIFILILTNLIGGLLSNSQIHQAISSYIIIGVYSFIAPQVTLMGIDSTIFMFAMAFALYLVFTYVRRDMDLFQANLLGYPVLVVMAYNTASLEIWYYFSLAIFVILSITQIVFKGETVKIEHPFRLFTVPIFIVTSMSISIMGINVFSLIPLAFTFGVLIYLSKLKILNNGESLLLIIISTGIMFSLAVGLFNIPIEYILVALYLHTGVLHLTEWIPYSRKIAHITFPYQLAVGYYFTFYVYWWAEILVIATIVAISAVIAVLSADILSNVSITVCATLISLNLYDFTIALVALYITLAMFTISGIKGEPTTPLLLLAPMSLLVARAIIYPLYTIPIGLAFMITSEITRKRLTKKVFIQIHPIGVYLIALAITMVSSYLAIVDLLFISLLFSGSIVLVAWIIDFVYDVKSMGYYVFMGTLTLLVVFTAYYQIGIETTVLLTGVGVFDLVSGIILERTYLRKTGMFSMIAAGVKGVFDTFYYLTLANISLYLKLAIGFLLLGLMFLFVSFIYIRFYRRAKLK